MNWIIKAAIQRAVGAMPYRHFWSELIKPRHSRDVTEDALIERLTEARIHLEHFQSMRGTREGFTALELGTGWFCVVPLAFMLCGATEVHSWDIAPLLKVDTLRRVAAALVAMHEADALSRHLPQLQPAQVEILRAALALENPSLDEMTRALRINYHVGEAKRTKLPADTIDLAVSDLVLQYIPYDDMVALFREFRRCSTGSLIMSHTIGLGDQYASDDPTISIFNFLRFPDWAWRLIRNPTTPLTRLRISDYRQAFRDAGFRIVAEHDQRGALSDLERVPLSKRFRSYDTNDLLVIVAHIVAEAV
jgi:hypothetical protein